MIIAVPDDTCRSSKKDDTCPELTDTILARSADEKSCDSDSSSFHEASRASSGLSL